MYKIKSTSSGADLGMTEAPYYIQQAANGCFIPCPEPDASGICFNGVVYGLLGRKPMDGVTDTVVLDEVDGGKMLADSTNAILDATELAVDLQYRMTLMELGITDDAGTTT